MKIASGSDHAGFELKQKIRQKLSEQGMQHGDWHVDRRNKVPGIRAAKVDSELEAKRSRDHNSANVLTLGAKRHR